MLKTRTPLLVRLLAVPVVVVTVLAGIWITGGVITNDFELAMWLTTAWMLVAGLVCVAVAARSRALRVPVLGAYVLAAGVVGAYLGSSLVLDRTVDERVAVAAPPPAVTQPDDAGARAPEPPRNVLLRAGRVQSVRHAATGRAQLIRLARGGRVLTLTDFEVDNGPDLRVYLVRGRAASEGEVDDVVDLGGLKGNRGDQQYAIPLRVDTDRHATVVIWCRAFSVLFARAPLDQVGTTSSMNKTSRQTPPGSRQAERMTPTGENPAFS